MSLLIKALDKAEKAADKSQEEQLKQNASRRRATNIASGEAAAGTHPHNLTQEFYSMQQGSSANASRAANVFDAKRLPGNEINPMVWILGFGLLALLAIGGYFYYQLNRLQPQQPPAFATQTKAESAPPIQIATASSGANVTSQNAGVEEANEVINDANVELPVKETADKEAGSESSNAVAPKPVEKPVKKTNIFKRSAAQKVASKSTRIRPQSPIVNTEMFDTQIANDSASIKIVKSKKEHGVQPALLQAYDAYSQGRDQDAQNLYMRVLQKDIRNVDALLGMGAIAERQGREKDALDWFKKVLEVEPRNTVALSAYYDQQLYAGNKEQKLKTLIAEQPNAANAHADLATYYAEQQEWALAQQSYFEAYRLNTNAESAFNLAVSLDQMGKSNLALNYYQEAITLSQDSSLNHIDLAAVKARINAIQSQ